MKSAVMNVRSTMECWQDGKCERRSRSKWIGINTTGIWLSFSILPTAPTLTLSTQPFDAHCCHMGTAIKHPVPERVKPSFLTSGHSDAHGDIL